MISHAQKKSREGTCSFSSPEPLGLICNGPSVKCPSTRILIVLKTESFFSSFKAFRHQKCRFSNNGLQSGVFSCKRWLIRDLSEFTQQDSRKKRTTKRLCVTNVTGKRDRQTWFHKVCGLLTSPVMLRKFTLKIRGRRRQVKRLFKSEFAVFQSSSRLSISLASFVGCMQVKKEKENKFRRCLFKVHDVTRDNSQRPFVTQRGV